LSDDEKKQVATGDKFTNTAAASAVTANLVAFSGLADAAAKKAALKNVDYDYLKCTNGGSGMSDLLPLMMMGGQGGMGGMDPMMMMLMMDGGDMSDMLPLMMMGGAQGQQQAGAMNPMMLMLLGDDEDKSKAACFRKYKVGHAFKADGTKVTAGADVVAVIEDMKANPANYGYTAFPTSGVVKEFSDCIVAAGTTVGDYSKSSSSSMDKLLPLMMMGGMGGQGGAAMDPMMMMLLLK